MRRNPGTLCLTFDNMGSAQAVGRGDLVGRGPDDVGPAGYPELLALLDRLGVTATFFIEGWNARFNPEAVQTLADRGHDVAAHAWVHDVVHRLDSASLERVLSETLAAFGNIGIRPTGFRAPGGKRGPYLLPLLKAYGFEYDSSIEHDVGDIEDFGNHIRPYYLSNGLPTIPWKWSFIDYYHYVMHPDGPRSTNQVREFFMTMLSELARDGGFATVIFHASVSCLEAKKFQVLEDVLTYAIKSPGIRVVTAQQAAREISHDAGIR